MTTAGDHFEVDHNPLGSISVCALIAALIVALIAVLVLQVATGLVADDEIATTVAVWIERQAG